MNEQGEIEIQAIVVMVCVSVVAIIIGYFLMSNMETANMPSMVHSSLSTSQNVLLSGWGNSATMLSFGAGVLAIVSIIGIMGGILGRGE